jgi:hypothetical protein
MATNRNSVDLLPFDRIFAICAERLSLGTLSAIVQS